MKNAIQPTRLENYPQWYQSVIQAAELAENGPVRGTMIMKPWGYALWESIQQYLDQEIKNRGHDNIYCPLFIPLSHMEKEAQHVEGFAKECAVVTHTRLVSDGEGGLKPASPLEEPLIVRPTSEMIMGDLFSKWVQSYRDLPVLVNQWANIVRWEMRTRMYLRTSEFLWQEGHTAHATETDARKHTKKMLDMYVTMCNDVLAIPVIPGEKSENERFPGAIETLTFEAMMQDGKALQLGTSHFLGQNFAKASKIQYQDKDGNTQYVWTTSWGTTTRLIGGLIMTHSDDDGLILPPALAKYHIVICPMLMKNKDHTAILTYCQELADSLSSQDYNGKKVRVHIDSSDKTGGEKNWHWVKKGVPIRLEVGNREITAQTVSMKKRWDGHKPTNLEKKDLLTQTVGLLKECHESLYQKAHDRLYGKLKWYDSYQGLKEHFSDKNAGFALVYWCEDNHMEQKLKDELSVTVRCLPFESLLGKDLQGECFFSNSQQGRLAILGRAY